MAATLDPSPSPSPYPTPNSTQASPRSRVTSSRLAYASSSSPRTASSASARTPSRGRHAYTPTTPILRPYLLRLYLSCRTPYRGTGGGGQHQRGQGDRDDDPRLVDVHLISVVCDDSRRQGEQRDIHSKYRAGIVSIIRGWAVPCSHADARPCTVGGPHAPRCDGGGA